MSFDDLKIRDLSRLSGEWTPPISAMGGPPAHELYTDLVVHAGLQLFRDARSRPWVVLRDGAQRRAFLAPSIGLRGALDRFRMRRNLRPVPENDIEEFVRVIDARISDPDVTIPLLRSPMVERASETSGDPHAEPAARRGVARWEEFATRVETAMRDLDGRHGARRTTSAPDARVLPHPLAAPRPGRDVERPIARPPKVEPPVTVSGGRGRPDDELSDLPRYVRVLRELAHDGSWMGTTQELSRLTHDDPFTLFDSLLRYRAEIADQGILIANVEVAGAYRWLAVDRTKVRGASEPRPEPRPVLAAE